MKIAISNLAWQPEEDRAIVPILHEFGVQGIELAPTKIWPVLTRVPDADIAAYRAFWHRQGITIVALQALLFGQPALEIFRDQKTRNETLAYLTSVMRLAAQLGAKILVFGSPRNRLRNGLNGQECLEIATGFFHQIGIIAAQHEVYFCIEPNPTVYGCDFIRTAAEGAELVRAVNHPHFRLHLDAGGMTLSNELYTQSITESIEWLAHFHISEPQLAIIGEGDTNHGTVAQALRQAQYANWVSIEMLNKTYSSNLQAVQVALAWATKYYL